jgi:hypothetical protein
MTLQENSNANLAFIGHHTHPAKEIQTLNGEDNHKLELVWLTTHRQHRYAKPAMEKQDKINTEKLKTLRFSSRHNTIVLTWLT